MISSKCSRGLEIEKNDGASISRFPPARMCFRSLLLQGGKSCAAPLDVEIWAMLRQMTTPSWKNSFDTMLSQLRKYHWCKSARLYCRVASKISATARACWPASKLRSMPPLSMECQINDQKSQIFPNTNLDRLGHTARYLQLHSFTFFHNANCI